MSKQKTFGRSRPSIAHELEYRRMLQDLLHEMQIDVQKEIDAYLKNNVATDAITTITWAQVMKFLRERWYKRFDSKSRELAKWITDKTRKRTRAQVLRKLKQMGMLLKPHYSKQDKEFIRLITQNNVALIKSIPQQYLQSVQQAVNNAFLSGYDMQALTEQINAAMERVDNNSTNRAALIARDQINKTTQQFAIFEAKAVGATKGRWIHVPGKYSSRITHIKMNGQTFNLDDGLYDADVHKNVKPGELVYCNCQFETLIPGFDE